MLMTLSNAALVNSELGFGDEARRFAGEFVDLLARGVFEPGQLWEVIEIAWVADELGCRGALREALASANPDDPWRHAAEAVLDRDFELTAEVFEQMGYTDEAYARLKAAEKLVAEGRRTAADVQLERALAFFRSVGATRYIHEGEALPAAPA
jgi:hypothetical protein